MKILDSPIITYIVRSHGIYEYCNYNVVLYVWNSYQSEINEQSNISYQVIILHLV